MEHILYEITQDDFVVLDLADGLAELNEESLYLYDIKASYRSESADMLERLGVPLEVCTKVLNPMDHIRFEYYDACVYGELSYYSKLTNTNLFIGIIALENKLFLVQELGEKISDRIQTVYASLNSKQRQTVNAEFLIYILIQELLSKEGEMVLKFRETIEELALEFAKKKVTLSSEDIFEMKTKLSNFSRGLERLFFTLSFPPIYDTLDKKSMYFTYFKDLLETMGFLKISLVQSEERLNSLSDHLELLIQERSNKRLNFLTIIQAVFVPLTLLAGIYGMNFKYMPELEYKYAYFIAIAAMFIIGILTLIYFKKRGWFN